MNRDAYASHDDEDARGGLNYDDADDAGDKYDDSSGHLYGVYYGSCVCYDRDEI